MLEPRDAVLEMLRAKGYPEVERSKFGGYEGRCPCKHATRVAVFFNPKGDPGECLMHCKPSVIRKAVGDEPLRNGNGAEGLPFIMGDKAPRPILENILVAMSQIPWEGLIAYDELAVRPMLMGLTPAHIARFPATKYPRPWNDADDAIVASWLQAKWNLFVKPSQIPDAVRAISVQHSYHPARDYLSDLKWDGKPRLDTWLQDSWG
jgi:hypothetical protein